MIKIKKVSLAIIIIMTISIIFSLSSNVIGATQGSLTIIKYEKGATGHEGENTPLSGVEFSIYKVADDATDTSTPAASTVPTAKDTTGNDGKVIFSNLDLGRYLVVESKAPENVTERIANFLIDIPQTNASGTGIDYDVTVSPKNNTAYGNITLTKEGVNSQKLQGVKFLLQKKDGTTWNDYPDAARAVLSTNASGQINVENLPIGTYRFVETDLVNNTGYILDNQTGYEFNVSLNTSDFKTVVTPSSITVLNDKPNISKEIDHVTRKNTNTNSVKDGKNSIDIGDVVTYKTEVDIPMTIERLDTYIITDTMDNGLTLNGEGFSVKAGNTELNSTTDYTLTPSTGNHGFTLELKQSGKTKLDVAYKAGTKKVSILYDVTLNSDADATSTGNKNKVKLSYSNIVNTNYKNESNNPNDPSKIITTNEIETTVYTGGLQIEKRENNRTGTLLSGAIFKIASTKTDAENKNFIKDSNGNEIVLETVNGIVSYKGLTYGKYYLVEVQAPSYEEEGTIKYYNLLDKPVEITVSNNTYTQNANIVINRKQSELPLTGAAGTVGIVFVGIALIAVGIIVYKKK